MVIFEVDSEVGQSAEVVAVTGGTDAQAQVTVRLEENGESVNGQGADHDTLVASVRAYVNALNKLPVKRERTKPEPFRASAQNDFRGMVPGMVPSPPRSRLPSAGGVHWTAASLPLLAVTASGA